MLAYTAGTAAWWLSHPPTGGWAQAFADDAYPWPAWTSCASLLALWIESAVGVSQYYAARRDAVRAAHDAEQTLRTAELMHAVAVQSDAITEMMRLAAARDEAMAAAVARVEDIGAAAQAWMGRQDEGRR